jgi:hypothetical protein
MSRPFILEIGRGRLILNEMPDCASLTIEVGGSGHTILPNKRQCLQAAAALVQAAKRLG